MNFRITKASINNFLVKVFVIICVIFPDDIFSLKKIIFIALILLNFCLILTHIKDNKFISFIGFYFPCLLICYSLILGTDFLTAFSRTFCCFMFLLIPIIKKYKINYQRMFLNSIYSIVFLTLFFFLGDILGVFNINSSFPLKDFFINSDVCILGKSVTYPLYYKVYFKTSPLVVFLLFYSLNRGKLITLILSFTTLLLSGTRANLYISLLAFIIYFFIYFKNTVYNIQIFKIIAFIVLIFLIVFNFNNIFEFLYNSIFVKGELSNMVRIGHLEGLIDLYKIHPEYLILGMGMGASFYSYSLNRYTSSIELPYIDLYRQMGLIFFLIFLAFILYPIKLLKKEKEITYAYIAYLLIAATNPLLFSSTAFLVYVYVYIISDGSKKLDRW